MLCRGVRDALLALLPLTAFAPLYAEPAVDPLSLGVEDKAPAEAIAGLSLEGWLQGYSWRNKLSSPSSQGRLAVDFRRDWTLSPHWRASLSNRLESAQPLNGTAQTEARNVLRESFFSWHTDFSRSESGGQADAEIDAFYVDVGRINQRLGVASGYNPTDYFRAGSVISSVSQNLATLRQNRLGTVTVRAQWLSATHAVSLAWVPQLSDRDTSDTHSFSLGLERTNRQQASLLRWASSLGERISLDIPVLARNSRIETGLNVTALVGDSLVTTLELSTARRDALPTVADAVAARPATQQRSLRLAVGGTWTAASGIALTLERHYAGEALTKSSWNAWRRAMRQGGAGGDAANAAFGRLASDLGYRQDLLVRDMWFGRIAWDDAFQRKGLNLVAFMPLNAYDRSHSWQAEASWNDRRDWSLRFIVGGNRGGESSEFGKRAQQAFGSLGVVLFW